jgi:hypothetical protein
MVGYFGIAEALGRPLAPWGHQSPLLREPVVSKSSCTSPTSAASVRTPWQAAGRFYARNQRIVDDSDLVVTFVRPDRTGRTEDTIRRPLRDTRYRHARV